MAKESKRPVRWLVSVLIAIAAAAMILYGTAQAALADSLSAKRMRTLADGAQIGPYMDRPALVGAYNTVIYKWTNAFSSSSVYLTEQILDEYCGEEDIRRFIGELYATLGRTLKTGGTLRLTEENALSLIEPLRADLSAKLGTEITREMCLGELNAALEISDRAANYPRLVRLVPGLALIGAALLLLAVMLFVRRENLFMGGFYLALSFGIPGVALLIGSGTVPASAFRYPFFPAERWIGIFRASLRTFGTVCLVTAAAGVLLMIAYVIDKRRVGNLVRNRRREEDQL